MAENWNKAKNLWKTRKKRSFLETIKSHFWSDGKPEKVQNNCRNRKTLWKSVETGNVFLKAVENRKDPKRQWHFAENGKSEKRLWKDGKINIFLQKTWKVKGPPLTPPPLMVVPLLSLSPYTPEKRHDARQDILSGRVNSCEQTWSCLSTVNWLGVRKRLCYAAAPNYSSLSTNPPSNNKLKVDVGEISHCLGTLTIFYSYRILTRVVQACRKKKINMPECSCRRTDKNKREISRTSLNFWCFGQVFYLKKYMVWGQLHGMSEE